ncbi:MAG: hypothetical protein BWY06_02462 [Candidatus Latescibacteria bacterium ADurb.Bin168]|nr:MAG: hypothetical protein BWY06_02462 [Candidatus Latescibacteria bacterium ADurb.Bin168]
MGAGKNHLRPLRVLQNVLHVSTDRVLLAIAITGYLLGYGQDSFRTAQIYDHVATKHLLRSPYPDIADGFAECLVHPLSLSFAHLLDEHLLRGLNSHPSECGEGNRLCYSFANRSFGIYLLRVSQRNLDGGVLDLFHYCFVRPDDYFARVLIHFHVDIVGKTEFLLRRRKQPLLQRIDD